MVKKIKKAQKSLVLTTSPRSYWFNSCIHTRRSLRGGVGYSSRRHLRRHSRPGVTFLYFPHFSRLSRLSNHAEAFEKNGF